MNFQSILNNFPPASQNNSRAIIKSLLERYIAKPSYYIQKKLEEFGIGVNWSEGYGDDIAKPEGFTLINTTLEESMSDEEMGEVLGYATIQESVPNNEESDFIEAQLTINTLIK